MAAAVMIGKKEYTLAPLVFDQMERVWPLLQKHMDDKQLSPEETANLSVTEVQKRTVEATRDTISILAVALEATDLKDTPLYLPMPSPPVHSSQEAKYDELMRQVTAQRAFLIRKTLIAGEIPLLKMSIINLMVDSGLSQLGNVEAETGEFEALLREMDRSMGTSEGLSGFSSLQELKEAAGA